jgi:hypothetical protein
MAYLLQHDICGQNRVHRDIDANPWTKLYHQVGVVIMSACENLPQELILAIVDNVRDDKKSLKAFSLVCKAWTNPARDHLFASLTILYAVRFSRFARSPWPPLIRWQKDVDPAGHTA